MIPPIIPLHAKDLLDETHEQHVLTLTLGNGRAHALSLGLIEALHDALNRAACDQQTRVVVIHGPGTIFCAGHDLKEIARHRADADQGLDYLTTLFAACARLMQTLATFPRPTLARVEGIATAAGLQLATACDLVFAATTARFCLPGVRNGGFCTTPAVAVSRAIGPKPLMELLLSGEERDAAWALRTGLVTEVMDAADLPTRTETFARLLATRKPGPIAEGKASVLAQRDLDLDAAYALATPTMIRAFMAPDRPTDERFSAGN